MPHGHSRIHKSFFLPPSFCLSLLIFLSHLPLSICVCLFCSVSFVSMIRSLFFVTLSLPLSPSSPAVGASFFLSAVLRVRLWQHPKPGVLQMFTLVAWSICSSTFKPNHLKPSFPAKIARLLAVSIGRDTIVTMFGIMFC